MAITKEDIIEAIEAHEKYGRRYGWLALIIFITSYGFLLYLIISRT